ncbi:hypothetical protein CK203_018907 [Vitis vinifera]|uniref:Retrovirus-related Pol polyprotein from transposon TNT 1-94 n=1 Tax=Vitis vinifera TaxID=29760 RepID=A0A438IQU2_VITVI|nr:hypothetical protein CK203_018907 [Vitis vinifera]
MHTVEFCYFPATSNPGISLQLSAIKPLTGNNFEEWFESFNVNMTLQNLDLALRVDEPSKLTDVSSADERLFYERWEHSNRSCLMVMKFTMDKSIKECGPKTERAKDFLEYVKANYTKVDKAEMATHLKLLTTTVYDGVSGVRDHIIKLRHYFNKANEMKVELGEKFLKWLILESLPASFDAVKLTYNALKEEWTLEELMSIVVQHEVSLKKHETHSLALVTNQASNVKKKPPHKNFGGSKQFKRKGNSNQGTSNASVSSNAAKSEKFKGKCNFCHKIGHKQNEFEFFHVVAQTSRSISRQRLERLVKDGVLSNLDFSDFETCVVCLKGKMTAKTRKEKIDRFGYVELIHEKSDSLNVFKAFKAKVELQLGKPIKAVKSDRGGEYYGRYDETGRNPGPFAKFLLECGIDAEYTLQALLNRMGLQKGGIAHLPVSLCLRHLMSYGQERNPAFTISMFGDVRLRGSRFYCPSHTTRIIESDRAVYFEDEVNVDPNFVPREILFGEEHVVIPFPTSHVPNMDVPIVQQPATNQGEHGDQVESDLPVDDTVVNEVPLRRSQRVRRPAISDDYMVYLQEHEYDSYDAFDPVTYQEAIHCPHFISWKKPWMMK